MIDITRIVDILKKHPQGLKAKEIANCISGADRKSINQILYANPQTFSCNERFEWTLTTQLTTPKQQTITKTKDEIKNFFPNEYIDKDTVELLKEKSFDELKKYKARFDELLKAINTSHDFYFSASILIQKAILVSEEQFNQILNRTKKLRALYETRNFEEWETIIFSPKFDELCANIRTLQECQALEKISTEYSKSDDWMKIISKRPDMFNEFISRVELLAKVQEKPIEYDILNIALSRKFSRLQPRIQKIIELQTDNKFPVLSWIHHQLTTLLSMGEERFEKCLKHADELYNNKTDVLHIIRMSFNWSERGVFDVILLNDDKFNLFCENIMLYSYSSLINSFEYDEWLNFFLNDKEVCLQAIKNITALENAIFNKRILPQTRDEKARCMWLSEEKFLEDLSNKKQEKIKDDYVKSSLSKTLAKYKDKPLRQCIGNCGICKREKCVLEL